MIFVRRNGGRASRPSTTCSGPSTDRSFIQYSGLTYVAGAVGRGTTPFRPCGALRRHGRFVIRVWRMFLSTTRRPRRLWAGRGPHQSSSHVDRTSVHRGFDSAGRPSVGVRRVAGMRCRGRCPAGRGRGLGGLGDPVGSRGGRPRPGRVRRGRGVLRDGGRGPADARRIDEGREGRRRDGGRTASGDPGGGTRHRGPSRRSPIRPRSWGARRPSSKTNPGAGCGSATATMRSRPAGSTGCGPPGDRAPGRAGDLGKMLDELATAVAVEAPAEL